MVKISKNNMEYYVINKIEDIQKQMLHLLKIVDKICKENDLSYFLDGGTAIGAYRHKGFIPWDDDLDISMLKADYLKLLSILRKLDKRKYFLYDYNCNLHCCTFFGEKVSIFPSSDKKKINIYPIKIDIRPLNVIENSPDKLEENRIYRELANLIIYKNCNAEYEKKAKELFEKNYNNDSKAFLSFYNLEYGLYNNYSKALFVHPYLKFSSSDAYYYNDIFPLKNIEFNDMKTYVPSSDILLTKVYGNYMSLPDIEDRKPEAAIVFRATSNDALYRFLINKDKKTVIEKMNFVVNALLKCKK